jgi:hypothetical protein
LHENRSEFAPQDNIREAEIGGLVTPYRARETPKGKIAEKCPRSDASRAAMNHASGAASTGWSGRHPCVAEPRGEPA